MISKVYSTCIGSIKWYLNVKTYINGRLKVYSSLLKVFFIYIYIRNMADENMILFLLPLLHQKENKIINAKSHTMET